MRYKGGLSDLLLLTASQVRYKLGALPVLYALLQTLEVEQIINRHCPTRGRGGAWKRGAGSDVSLACPSPLASLE